MTENLPEKKKPGFRLTAKRIGWLLLILVWLVGLLLIWYGKSKIAEGAVLKQQIQRSNLLATQHLAKMASEQILSKVRPMIKANDLGSARAQLENADELVEVISTIVLTSQTKQVNDIKGGLQQALDLLASDPKQADTLLDQVGQQLYILSGETAGG